ncbi:MAG: hypothetical protein RL367_2354 [Pseudomonadota bacterium]|jgi:osmotically inducible lipoprotein OsmB
MNHPARTLTAIILAASIVAPAQASQRCHSRKIHLNKTGGAIVGGVGGGLLGKAIFGGPTGVVVGVVGGGLAGHALAKNKRRHGCR